MSSPRQRLRIPAHGGGWQAAFYIFKRGGSIPGAWRLTRALLRKNTCKTCALGMGGQRGGMVNERGHFPSVCKKSIQAMAADMQGAIRPDFFSKFSLNELGALSPRELEAAGRLTQPLIAAPGAPHYQPIAWDDALDRIAAKLKQTAPADSFFYLSGRSSNEAAFLLQLFARLYGTNNVSNCSYYCHQASGVGLASVLGTGTATIDLEGLESSDLLFVIGGNPASNHPRLMHSMIRMRRKGGRIIVINPLREPGLVNFRIPSDPISMLFGSRIADLYLQPHIGGDIAVLAGIGKGILERNAQDADFLGRHTTGTDGFFDQLRALEWPAIEAASGVSRPQLEQAAELYGASHNTVFSWTMGITHHEHGVQNVQMIGALALLRGMVGKPRAGLLPIRGHSNVQGIGSMGVTPRLKAEIFRAIEQRLGVQLPTSAGLDTLSALERAGAGHIRFALCLGGNLFGASPDADFARRAFAATDLVVYLDTTLNTGHALGLGRETIILPALARDEEAQSTTQESMFNYVRLSDGGPTRHVGPRGEVRIVAALARRLLGDASPVDWHDLEQHRNIRRLIAQVVPGYQELESIDRTRQEFNVQGRIHTTPTFSTADGRAHFHPFTLPSPPNGSGELRLMTIRSEGQFNTVVYEEEDLYRGQERRDVILMNAEDIRRRGLAVDQRVTVRSDTGFLSHLLVRAIDIPSGNAAMYYPEANVLVPRTVDAASRTPAYKSVRIWIETEIPEPDTGSNGGLPRAAAGGSADRASDAPPSDAPLPGFKHKAGTRSGMKSC